MRYFYTLIILILLTSTFHAQDDRLVQYQNLENKYLSFWESKSYDELEQVLDQMVYIAEDLDDAPLLIEVLLKRHHYKVYVKSDSNSGFIAIHKALEIARDKGLDDYQMRILSRMSIFQFATYSDFDSAEDYARQMTKLNEKLKSRRYGLAISQLKCQIYSFRKFFEIDVSAETYETCIKTLPQSLEYFEPSDFLLYRQARFTAILGFSDFFGNEKCLEYLEQIDHQPNLPVVNQNEYFGLWFRMVFLYQQKKYDEVLLLVEKNKRLISQLSTPVLKHHFALLSRVYEAMGLYEEALDAAKQMNFHNEKQTATAFSDKLQGIVAAQKADKFESDNSALKRRNTIISVITLLALVSLSVFTYFYIRLGRQNKLIQLQKEELTAVNKSKNKLFGILAHDLRSPITSLHEIGQKVQFLISKKEWATLDQMGRQINTKLRNMNSLLENIIPWVMSQIKNPELKKVNVELSHLINQCIAEFDDKIKFKNISVINNVKGIVIETDKDALQIILRNVLSNALKFSPHDAEIKVESELNGEGVDILIRDKGKGIAQDKLEHIFTDYSSTDGYDGEKGHGLGLKLSKDLALWLDAKLEIESSTELGTTVRLSMVRK